MADENNSQAQTQNEPDRPDSDPTKNEDASMGGPNPDLSKAPQEKQTDGTEPPPLE